jgi:hypothetical protein
MADAQPTYNTIDVASQWHRQTPTTMLRLSDAQLLEIRAVGHGAIHDTWAGAELARRQNVRLGELISELTKATELVRREVGILADSSERMERQTIRLNWYTVALLFFGAVQIAVAVVQTWKMLH